MRNSGHYDSEYTIGQIAGTIDRFIFSIRNGDYILFPVSHGFHLGTVKSSGTMAHYNQIEVGNDRAWQWDIEWQRDLDGSISFFSRTLLDGPLHYTLKSRGTCLDLGHDAAKQIEQSIKRTRGVDLNLVLLEENKEFVNTIKVEIQKSLNEDKLEYFVKRLLEKEGAAVNRPPKNQGMSGDVDLEASFSASFLGGSHEEVHIYAYQLKHHVGETDDKPVTQLINRFQDQKYDARYAKDIAITSGYFSDAAMQQKDNFNTHHMGSLPEIVLLDGLGLARWVIESGLTGLELFEDQGMTLKAAS